MKTIYLVTHGEKGTGLENPDPCMTIKGFIRVESLKQKLFSKFLPNGPSEIHIGTGKRHWQVVKALGLANQFSSDKFFFSSLYGEASTLIKQKDAEAILLGHGLLINPKQYLNVEHLAPRLKEAICQLPNNTLICSGRAVLVRLGVKTTKCQSGAVYLLTIKGKLINISLLIKGVVLTDDSQGTEI